PSTTPGRLACSGRSSPPAPTRFTTATSTTASSGTGPWARTKSAGSTPSRSLSSARRRRRGPSSVLAAAGAAADTYSAPWAWGRDMSDNTQLLRADGCRGWAAALAAAALGLALTYGLAFGDEFPAAVTAAEPVSSLVAGVGVGKD